MDRWLDFRTLFKFQSDSINTGTGETKRTKHTTLNSNLILLIPTDEFRLWEQSQSLNSNLILLIRIQHENENCWNDML